MLFGFESAGDICGLFSFGRNRPALNAFRSSTTSLGIKTYISEEGGGALLCKLQSLWAWACERRTDGARLVTMHLPRVHNIEEEPRCWSNDACIGRI